VTKLTYQCVDIKKWNQPRFTVKLLEMQSGTCNMFLYISNNAMNGCQIMTFRLREKTGMPQTMDKDLQN
jgi:hypothetical protein